MDTSSYISKKNPILVITFFLISWMFIVQLMFPSRLGVEVYGVTWINFFGFSGQHITELILSTVSHANMGHLIGNVYGLLFFYLATNEPFERYSLLEVFSLFIGLGIISNGLSFLLYSIAVGYHITIIGSSGAVIGLYGYHMAKYLTTIDIKTNTQSILPTIKYNIDDVNQYLLVGLSSFYIILSIQQQLTIGFSSVQTAHLAHIIGFMFGGILFVIEYYSSDEQQVDPLIYE